MSGFIEFAHHYLFIAVISALLAAMAVGFLVRFVRPALSIKKQLQAAFHGLRQIKASSLKPREDIEEASEAVFTSPSLIHGWREYRETLHAQRIVGGSGKPEELRWRSTALAETFFSSQALVDTPLKTEFYKHLPGILTGLGIIGTFSGLVTGLIRFEVSGDAERIRESLNGLIQSVGYSFLVSALAITLSMVFIWIEKSLVTECRRKVESLCQVMDSLFETGALEEYLARLVASSETSAGQVHGMRESLAGELKQVFAALLTQQMKTTAALNRQLLAGAAQDIGESIRVPMERIALALNRGAAAPALTTHPAPSDSSESCFPQMQEAFQNQLRETLTPLKDTLTGMETAVQQMSKCVQNLKNSGKGAEDELARQIGRLMGALDARQEMMDRSMSEFVAQSSQVSGYQTEAAKDMGSIMQDISLRMATAIERLEAGSRNAADEFASRHSMLTQQAGALMGEINGQLRSLAQEMRLAGEVTRESSSALALMVRESTEVFTAGREALKSSLADFLKASGTVSATLACIQKASAGIQGSSANLVTATAGVRDMLETHKRTSDIFAGIVSDLRATIENARHEASMTSEIVSRIQKATQQLGIAQGKAEEYLHGLTEVLAQAHSEFAGNVELTLKRSNTQFHEELSRAVSLVSGAIQDFGDVLDAASMKDRKPCWV